MMKQTFIITFALLIVNISFAQFNTKFNDTIRPFGDGSYANRTICQDDFFYYIGGVFNSGGANSVNQYYILKLDKQGNLIKKNTYSDTALNYHSDPYNSMIIDGNKIVSCIITENTTQYEIKSKIISINKNTLDTIWTKTYPHPDTANILSSADNFNDITSIKSIANNNFILAGSYMKAGNHVSCLMKIDSVGNKLWIKTYDNNASLYEVDITPSGGYIFYRKDWGLFVVNADSVGNILWEKRINSYTIQGTVADMAYAGDDDFIGIVKYRSSIVSGDSKYGLNIFKINSLNQQIKWNKTYQLYNTLQGITMHQAMGVETLADGSIIVSGTLAKAGADRKGFIFKLDSNGDSLWTMTYDYGTHHDNNDRCQLNDLLVCDDGGFFGVGYYWDKNSNNVAWLFKTDANGVVGWETSASLSALKINVSPNPATSFINIDFGNMLMQKSEINIYNSLGKLVLQKKLRKGKESVKLNIEGLKSGVYFIELKNLDGTIGAGKFVVN